MTLNEELEIPLYHLELVRDRSVPFRKMGGALDAAQVFHEVLDCSPVEQFMVIYLDSTNSMVGAEKVAVGQLEMVHISMREMFRGAIHAAAPRIVMGHNHPSGDPTPSQPDILLTEAAVQAGALLGISVRNHIVVSPSGTHISVFEYAEKVALERIQNVLGYPLPKLDTMSPEDIERLTDKIMKLAPVPTSYPMPGRPF